MNPFLPSYGGAGFNESGNILQDPVIPAISGASILKVAVAVGIFIWLFRSFGNKG